MSKIGVITEQNDLGLGFDPLSPQDQKAYNEGNISVSSSTDNTESNENKQKKND